MSTSGDAERLAVIADLERAIRARQPDLLAARQAATAAATAADRRRQATRQAEGRLAGLDRAALRSGPAVYLDGQALDAGRLELGHEVVRYHGWHGQARAPLQSIVAIEVGVSNLPPRVGVPLLARLWPGPPRPGGALVLGLADADGRLARQMVLAGLADPEEWHAAITAQRARLGEVATQRAGLDREVVAAVEQQRAAEAVLAERRAALEAIESEVRGLQRQRDDLRQHQRQVEQTRRQVAQRQIEALKKSGKGRR